MRSFTKADRSVADADKIDRKYCLALLRSILDMFKPGRMERVNITSVDTTNHTVDAASVGGVTFTIPYLRSIPLTGPWWALVVDNTYVLVNVTNGA